MKTLILVGAGHAHAVLLKALMRHPLPGLTVHVVSPAPVAPYSGMVPGWLAGVYDTPDICVDFVGLCRRLGVRLVRATLVRLDPDARCLYLSDGSTLTYDILSLNVGSTLDPPATPAGGVLTLRPPLQAMAQYGEVRKSWSALPRDSHYVLGAAGGGAAGMESLLAVQAALRSARPDLTISSTLYTCAATLLPGYAAVARRKAEHLLQERGVKVVLNTTVTPKVIADTDLMLWATGAQAHPWQRNTATRGTLAVDQGGFIRIDHTLRSQSHHNIFATGDCAAWPGGLPKAGVHAVRMGSVLARNLCAAAREKPLHKYHPRRHHLALIGCGDGTALACYGGFAIVGKWAWTLKQYIDRRFIARHS